jgi:hypothetical protein
MIRDGRPARLYGSAAGASPRREDHVMRKISLLQATSLVLVLGASNAYAMCGSNLSPGRTPYAVLQPQTTVAVLSAPAPVATRARVKATPPANR